jgi:hypothetical protein
MKVLGGAWQVPGCQRIRRIVEVLSEPRYRFHRLHGWSLLLCATPEPERLAPGGDTVR